MASGLSTGSQNKKLYYITRNATKIAKINFQTTNIPCELLQWQPSTYYVDGGGGGGRHHSPVFSPAILKHSAPLSLKSRALCLDIPAIA